MALTHQALYLPLFYEDPQGVVHPGAATEIPTVQNGEVSSDATTWTFHLATPPVWPDGQPYDARDVDFTWRLWVNPKFGAYGILVFTGLNPISSVDVSTDHLLDHLPPHATPMLLFLSLLGRWHPRSLTSAPFQLDGTRAISSSRLTT